MFTALILTACINLGVGTANSRMQCDTFVIDHDLTKSDCRAEMARNSKDHKAILGIVFGAYDKGLSEEVIKTLRISMQCTKQRTI